jgi:hypothetical protein
MAYAHCGGTYRFLDANDQWVNEEAHAIRLADATAALTAIDEERDALREALAALRSHPKIAGCRPLASGELRSLFDNADAALARSLSSVSREDTLRSRAATPSNKKGV